MSDLQTSNPSPEQIAEWIVQARAGSQASLGELMRFSRQFLLMIANQEIPTELQAKGGASDVVQETQFEAANRFGVFQGHTPAELLAWLRGILRHNVQDFTRRYMRVGKRQVQREIPLADRDGEIDFAEQLMADQSSPSSEMQRTELAARIETALGKLSQDHRQVILWHHRDGLSFEQIGTRLGRSVGAVRKL